MVTNDGTTLLLKLPPISSQGMATVQGMDSGPLKSEVCACGITIAPASQLHFLTFMQQMDVT